MRCWPTSIRPTLSEAELMAWALPRAANQFWMLSEPERATAFLQTTRNRVTIACGARRRSTRCRRRSR